MHSLSLAWEPGRMNYSVPLESCLGYPTAGLLLTTVTSFNKCDAGTIYFPNVVAFRLIVEMQLEK